MAGLLRRAVDAKCRECIYDPGAAGTWRQQVTACTSPGCPLYAVRPLSQGRFRLDLGPESVPEGA